MTHGKPIDFREEQSENLTDDLNSVFCLQEFAMSPAQAQALIPLPMK